MSNYKMVPHRRLKISQIENLIIYILNMERDMHAEN